MIWDWFIALLGIMLFIIWIDSLLCKGKIKVYPSIEWPRNGQLVWAHDRFRDKWVQGYFSVKNQYLISLHDSRPYTWWDSIDYWVDLTEYK